MPKFRSDFLLNSHLVFWKRGQKEEVDTGQVLITFSNGAPDENNQPHGLIATVVGDAENIDAADQILREHLRQYLDTLSFSTQSAFSVRTVTRTMGWETGATERDFRSFHDLGVNYPPQPGLDTDYLKSANVLNTAPLQKFVRTALKYFRYGLLETDPEDQFMRFWLSLEVIAENTKSAEPVPIACPRCGNALNCSGCGAEPTRVPMATQAIKTLIATIVGPEATSVIKRQLDARNGLMHGRSVESIERVTKMAMGALVDELGNLAWAAIWKAMPPNQGELVFGHKSGLFTNRHLRVTVSGGFRHDGPGDQPNDDHIPSMQMNIERPLGDEDPPHIGDEDAG